MVHKKRNIQALGFVELRSRITFLIACQKVEGRKRTGKLTHAELQALSSAIRPLPKYSGYAHVEIDLNRQVVFIVDATGTITHILPVCTGNEKTYIDHGELDRAH